MNRLKATALNPSHAFSCFYVFAAMFAAALLLAAFSNIARAETIGCGDGLMGIDEAGTGTLMLRTSLPGRFLPAPRIATDVKVVISGNVARTRVTQRFTNPAEGWAEGIYVFPLPDTAAVDTLKMQIGDRFIEGDIKERKEARQIYETAKAEGKKVSLIEQQRPNVFTNSIANIGPHETVVVQIEYQEALRFDQGRFKLRVPLVVAPRYSPPATASLVSCESGGIGLNLSDRVPDREAFSAPVLRPETGKINPVTLAIHLEAGFPLGAIESSSHKIAVRRDGTENAAITLENGDVPADQDFALTYAPASGTMPSVSLLKERLGGADYLMALVVPPVGAAHAEQKPREAIFVLDNSGSMGGESIREAKAALLLALERLKTSDRFNVIRFDDTLTVLFPQAVGATAENIAYAKGFIASLEANGGTEMLPALRAALTDTTPQDTTHVRQVVFLTDGEVGNEEELFAAISSSLGRSRLFTVGIGSAPNAFFMSGAARAGRGTYTNIGDVNEVSARMAELFAKLEHPVMTDLAAVWPTGLDSEAWPNPLPDLYDGEPVVLTAKIPHAAGTLTLSGNLEAAPWTQSLDLADARPATGIARLWARNKIASLEDLRVRGGNADVIDKAVLEVALNAHLVSRVTSLVAVDVTATRPQGEMLTTQKLPLNLPAGWDFGKVFGEEVPLERRAGVTLPPALVGKMALGNAPSPVMVPEGTDLMLPQGGTASTLMLILGIISLIGAALLLRNRKEARA